jgi:NDP-sugar pyrophosphorylase family protein
MERLPFTITMRKDLIKKVDSLVDGTKIRNRSHALEYVASSFFSPKISKALILAGGKGVKMRPLTYELPKAMLPVKGKPILEYTIEQLKKNNIREIVIACGSLSEKIKDYFGDGSRFSVKITYIEEKKDLGTGGALKSALPILGSEPFIMIWGDVLADIDLADMIDFHMDDNPIMTIALTPVADPREYGSAKLHRDLLVDFQEKPKKGTDASHLVSAGIHIVDPKISKYLSNKKSFMIEQEILPALTKDRAIKGYIFDGKWFDVGSLEIYQKAIKYWTK